MAAFVSVCLFIGICAFISTYYAKARVPEKSGSVVNDVEETGSVVNDVEETGSVVADKSVLGRFVNTGPILTGYAYIFSTRRRSRISMDGPRSVRKIPFFVRKLFVKGKKK